MSTGIKLTDRQYSKIISGLVQLYSVVEQLEEQNPGADIRWNLKDSCTLNLIEGKIDDGLCRDTDDYVIASFYFHKASGDSL